jgi:hypothetical protein
VRVKTYDFQAFCRGELIRTKHRQRGRQQMTKHGEQKFGFWDRVIERIEASVRWEIDTKEGRMYVIPLHAYGLYQPPYFLTVPVDSEDESDEAAKPQVS